jgi:hypothetical protein
MYEYIKIYEITAYYKDLNNEAKTFSFIIYGDDEKLLKELQMFYDTNKSEKNITSYHVDIYEGEYPVSSGNEIVYYQANEVYENHPRVIYSNLKVMLDKIKYEFNDYEYNDIKYKSLTFNEDGSIETSGDYLMEFILFENPLVDELYYVDMDGIIQKKEDEVVKTLK